ncbi:MAG: FtsX-like permease family protein [Thermoplasmatota archaeon]
MGLGRWILEHGGEIALSFALVLLLPVVFLGFLLPTDLRIFIMVLMVPILIILFIVFLFLVLFHRLQFKMGVRNLVRHKSDTVIAILGFMIGTSIICSSLAIGDTMNNMIETMVYDEFYLRDEYIVVVNETGGNYLFRGEQAQNLSDLVWSVNEEKDNALIDGVSWEIRRSAAVMDLDTALVEPMMNLHAYSPHTEDAFGTLQVNGEPVDYDLGPGEVYITKGSAEMIEGEPGHDLMISSGTNFRPFTIKEVVDDGGRAGWGSNNIFMSFDSLWSLYNITNVSAEDPGKDGDWTGGAYNILFISNQGGKVDGGELCPEVVEEVNRRLEDVPHPVDSRKDLEITGDKKTSVDMSKTAMNTFTQLFLALGTFSIIAGIALIINIFVMLAEERKEEMGISRAVGMKKRHLRMTYLFEGGLYSVISSAVGVVLGVITGYLIILFVERILQSFAGGSFEILRFYSVSPISLIFSFVGGFSITLATTLFITQRIARLNIVSAIRNTPVPVTRFRLIEFGWKLFGVWDERTMGSDQSKKAKIIEVLLSKLTFFGTMMVIGGSLFLLGGVLSEAIWPVMVGISVLLIGVGLLTRNFISERLTYNLVAVLVLTFWILPTPSIWADYTAGLEMFILSGIFMVSSGVLLLVWNTDIILWAVEKLLCLFRLSPASIKMAISYPVKKRFRTGVTIFMFALIIFTITGMSMITHIFNVNIESFERNVGGGYEIIGISNTAEIPDIQSELYESEVYDDIEWERSHSLTSGTLFLNITLPFDMGYQETRTTCVGISDEFMESNRYGFDSVAWDLIGIENEKDRSNQKVWQALKQDPDHVIVDSSFGGGGSFSGPPGMGTGTKVGDKIHLVALNGTSYNKTVIGISKLMATRGVFLYEPYAEEYFGVTEKNIHFISVEEGEDARDVANLMRKDLIRYGFYAIVVSEIIADMLSIQNSFFNLFNAFLALGLIIGIVGLGIVTLRSVYERRHEIGMMRAIGFKRKAVVGSFLMESGFIAGSGLTVGTLLGIILGWVLWRDDLSETLPEFGVPWSKLVLIVGAALLVALLFSIPPALKASRVAPADALRYE